jgi:dimeric dUTPase (all-alpha-NTP-PPase superfamily)
MTLVKTLDSRAGEMLRTMAEMQETHNQHVHPDWRTNDYEYYRAIWVECAELLDHFGWKWWKQQQADIDQVKLEIVDIWHFALSDLLRADLLTEELATPLFFEVGTLDVEGTALGADRFRAAVETLAESILTERRFLIEPFAQLMRALPMGFQELFEIYVGKNVLNNFRQDHGYKTGEYQKLWNGREDNEHLVEILRELSCLPDDIPAELYKALESRYSA